MEHTNLKRQMSIVLATSAAMTALLALPVGAHARYTSDTTVCAVRTAPTPTDTPASTGTVPVPNQQQTASTATASVSLAADLAFMREEEKLAHDLYTALGEKWDLRVFTNIAKSEQVHTDSILGLLNQYGIEDPAAGLSAGEYKNDELQALYNDLLKKGLSSSGDALAVGRLVEETDIADLDERIKRTDEEAVLTVYRNLRAASVKHLAAFSGNGGAGNGRRGSATESSEGRGNGQGPGNGRGQGGQRGL